MPEDRRLDDGPSPNLFLLAVWLLMAAVMCAGVAGIFWLVLTMLGNL